MRVFALFFLAVSAYAMPQTNFKFGSVPNRKIFIRGDEQNTIGGGSETEFTSEENEGDIGGRIPGEEAFGNTEIVEVEDLPIEEDCCCIPASEECQADLTEEELDLVGLGLINPRIVNRPTPESPSATTCPAGYKVCCSGETGSEVDTSVFGRSSCLPPTKVVTEPWVQGCEETPVYGETITGTKACGTQEYISPVAGLGHGETTPGEFPWSCLILNQNNDFIGSCAIIPNDSTNKNENGVRKVITAAHKLNDVQDTDTLKIRVGEYDASGFKAPEAEIHEEYTVTRILKHPAFNAARLSNDIALLFVDRNINLNHPYVNTACLPSCNEQFDFQFSNSSGVRCWVAGWGKNEFDGSFQFLQRKVDVPLVNNAQCNADLKSALNSQSSGVGDRFTLDPSEVCAGGEVGKDACTGDGGSPLVCQARSGRWTVVGLVTWGVGCAEQLPGVYVRVSQFRDWINNNNADIATSDVEVEVDADIRNVPRKFGVKSNVEAIRFV
eukprot:TRINITY_DN382_c0_g1_i11.p1 TRINITY_DN382_c0_g1~~TRINITY_DN382_c0_g1_i11.p1  ORF type:complete len:497 (-),score=165.67 TRINITY_DN382_c0_g1_i11:62-1552(-)